MTKPAPDSAGDDKQVNLTLAEQGVLKKALLASAAPASESGGLVETTNAATQDSATRKDAGGTVDSRKVESATSPLINPVVAAPASPAASAPEDERDSGKLVKEIHLAQLPKVVADVVEQCNVGNFTEVERADAYMLLAADLAEELSRRTAEREGSEFYLGEYTLWDDGTLGKVCIRHISGEGGQFPRFKVEDAIAKFFKENF